MNSSTLQNTGSYLITHLYVFSFTIIVPIFLAIVNAIVISIGKRAIMVGDSCEEGYSGFCCSPP